MDKYLTKQEYDKLKKELKRLETEGRKKVAEDLKRAVSFGDLSENAAYDDAKDAKSFLEGKIAELRIFLLRAKVVDKRESDLVQIGSTVIIQSGKEKMTLKLVGSTEVDVGKGKISCESPFGEALVNKKKGETIEVELLSGKQEYKIIDIKN